MPLRIFGCIRDESPNADPIAGLRIQAWDRDLLGGDDLLGETRTNQNGSYEIQIPIASLMEIIGAVEFGRPDIYLTIDNKNSMGSWVRLAETEEYTNYKFKDDLRIDCYLPFGNSVSKSTKFTPQTNGFHFINSFIVRPDILGMDLGEWNMGFCGGMCAGALNRFRAGLKPPDNIAAPLKENRLYDELMNRQKRSMSPKLLRMLLEWQSYPDMYTSSRKRTIGENTKAEWKRLKLVLDEGNPVIIVLVRSFGLFGNLTDNHQVLAIGYEFNPSDMDLVIYTYDPNFPDQTQTISMNLGLLDGNLDLEDSGSIKTRGFFINPTAEAAVEIPLTAF